MLGSQRCRGPPQCVVLVGGDGDHLHSVCEADSGTACRFPPPAPQTRLGQVRRGPFSWTALWTAGPWSWPGRRLAAGRWFRSGRFLVWATRCAAQPAVGALRVRREHRSCAVGAVLRFSVVVGGRGPKQDQVLFWGSGRHGGMDCSGAGLELGRLRAINVALCQRKGTLSEFVLGCSRGARS